MEVVDAYLFYHKTQGMRPRFFWIGFIISAIIKILYMVKIPANRTKIEKVALVTGSARGLGKHIAIELARQGYVISLNYCSSENDAKETLSEAQKHSPKSIMIKADVTDENQVRSMIQQIATRFGRLDVLINNVGNFIYKPLSETTSNEFLYIVTNNLQSVFLCTKYALPIMRKNGYGRVISFGSSGCDRLLVRKFTTPYYIAKTGVLLLTKAMATDEAKYGITLNTISPGILESSVVKHPAPARREARFEDITNAVLFLLSEKSDYVNGANIEVSGGLALELV